MAVTNQLNGRLHTIHNYKAAAPHVTISLLPFGSCAGVTFPLVLRDGVAFHRGNRTARVRHVSSSLRVNSISGCILSLAVYSMAMKVKIFIPREPCVF